MKVILKENIKGVGKKNEVINASDGYARNYLFPKNLAVEATTENMNKLNAQNESKKYKKFSETDKKMPVSFVLSVRNNHSVFAYNFIN